MSLCMKNNNLSSISETMEPLNELSIEKDEWVTHNNSNTYEGKNLTDRMQKQKISSINKRFMLIILVFIFTCGFLLIYSVMEIKFLEQKMKLRDEFQKEIHNKDINDLFQNYNELKSRVSFNSMQFQKQIGKSYLPYGPQTNIPLTTVISGGWFNCYSNGYQDERSADLSTIFNQFCTSPYLMIACKKKSNHNIDVLAWAGRKHVLFLSKTDFDFPTSHGTKWIYNNSSYIGFADQSDKVVIGVLNWNKNEEGQYLQVKCDTYANLADLYGDFRNKSKRLCWPITKERLNQQKSNIHGYEGRTYFGNGGTCFGSEWHQPDQWERIIFERETI